MRLIIWRFLDGNRAHEKQSAALVSGLRSCLGSDSVDCHDLHCLELSISLWRGLPEQLHQLPKPDLIVGAGHRSHWPMLRARRQFGGRSVVILQPSLPLHWFDFAIIPEHDRPPPLENVILTHGALAEPLPDLDPEAGRGLLLIGGPSRHYRWDTQAVATTADRLFEQPLRWVVSDSRRTPADTQAILAGSKAEFYSWRSCPPGWLAEQMARSAQIWVTSDSVSMISEALQSRARIGVIPLPSRTRANKVRSAVQRFMDLGLLSDRPEEIGGAWAPREPFNQQIVCARALLRRCGLNTLKQVEADGQLL